MPLGQQLAHRLLQRGVVRFPVDDGVLREAIVPGVHARQTADASAQAELHLGEDGRFWPSDEALARCRALADGGRAEIVDGA